MVLWLTLVVANESPRLWTVEKSASGTIAVFTDSIYKFVPACAAFLSTLRAPLLDGAVQLVPRDQLPLEQVHLPRRRYLRGDVHDIQR